MRRLLLLLLASCTLPLVAEDVEFLRAWKTAQQKRPASVGSTAPIAGPAEPGTSLTIQGRVVTAKGTVVANAIVFAWQTDATGVYDRPGAPAHSWRLRGWVRTDKNGSFTFQTIRPAAYPNHREPAHVHFSIETATGEKYFARDLLFADDPLIQGTSRASSAARVTTKNGRQHVSVTLQMDPARKF